MRKLISMLLCLVMALTMPLGALAATEYSVSIVPGDELAAMEGIKDLLDTLTLRFIGAEQSGAMTLTLGDTDALSIALRGDGDGVYVTSDLLGDKPLYFSKEEIAGFMAEMAQSENMDEESAANMQQSIALIFVALGGEALPQTTEADSSFDMEAGAEQVAEMFSDDPAMADFVTGMMESLKITDGEYTSDAHDPADQMCTMTMTSEDLLKLADSKQVIESMMNSAAQSGTTVTAEEAAEAYRQVMKDLDFQIPLTIYTVDKGETLIAMEIPMTIKGTVTGTKMVDGKETTVTEDMDMAMDLNYNRLTVDGVKSHNFKLTASDEGTLEMDMTGSITAKDDNVYTLTGIFNVNDNGTMTQVMAVEGELTTGEEASSGWLGMLADDEQISYIYEGSKTAAGREKSLAVYMRSDASAVVAPAAADRPLFTLKVAVDENASDAVLADVNAATVDGSTRLLAMTSEELETAMQAISTSAMQSLFNIMSLLPASTLQMFMATDAN